MQRKSSTATHKLYLCYLIHTYTAKTMRIFAVLLVLPAFILSGCGVTPAKTVTAPPSTVPSKIAPATPQFSLVDANGTAVHGWLPAKFDITKTYQWVIFDHGHGQLGSAIFNDPQVLLLTTALTNAGYVIASSEYATPNCWGDASCVEDSKALYDVFTNTLNLDPKPFVIGQSMGGMVMWNAILHASFTPKAVAGIYPACNLLNMYQSASFSAEIQADYSFTSSSTFATATKGYDPVNSELLTPLVAVPALIWSSYGDTVVSRADNEDLLAKAVSAAGGSMTIITTVGDHGDNSNFDAPTLVAFFDKYKGN